MTNDELYAEARTTAIPSCRGLGNGGIVLSPDLEQKLKNTLGVAAGNMAVLNGHPTAAAARAQADRSLGQLGAANPKIDGDATIQSGVHTGTGCSQTMVQTIYGPRPQTICPGQTQGMPFGGK